MLIKPVAAPVSADLASETPSSSPTPPSRPATATVVTLASKLQPSAAQFLNMALLLSEGPAIAYTLAIAMAVRPSAVAILLFEIAMLALTAAPVTAYRPP